MLKIRSHQTGDVVTLSSLEPPPQWVSDQLGVKSKGELKRTIRTLDWKELMTGAPVCNGLGVFWDGCPLRTTGDVRAAMFELTKMVATQHADLDVVEGLRTAATQINRELRERFRSR